MNDQDLDCVSVLTAKVPQTKRFKNGNKLRIKPAYLWIGSDEAINNLQELHSLLVELQIQPNSVIIRGRFNGDGDSRQPHRRLTELYDDIPHHWFCVDVDDIPLEEIDAADAVSQHQVIVKNIPELQGAPCIFQFSASAGLSDKGKIKAHLWFWNKRKLSSKEVKRVFADHKQLVDLALFNAVQIHYTAQPIFVETPCAIDQRTHFVAGDVELDLRVPPVRKQNITTTGGLDLSKDTCGLVSEIGPGNHNKGIYRAFLSAEIKGEDAGKIFDELAGRNIPDYGKTRLMEQWRRAKEWANREYFSPLNTDAHEVRNLKQRYLDIDLPSEGGIFIRSPQGTGKTQLLAQLENRRVLVVGHSVSLLRQAAKRLNLTLYRDTERPYMEDRLAITYNSLWKLRAGDGVAAFDTVIIDESDQFAIFSATAPVVMHREVQEGFFEYLVRSAQRVICLDADLSDLSVLMIRSYRDESFHFYLNEYPVVGEVTFFRSAGEARAKVADLLTTGARVFVPHENKLDCKAFHEELETCFPDKKGLCLHGDNADSHSEFFTHPNQYLREHKVDWLVCSPVIRTGVSFERSFDYTVGIFNSSKLVFDAPTIVQALMRERHPKGVMACVSYHRKEFIEAEFDRAYDEGQGRIDPETGRHTLLPIDQRAIAALKAERTSKANRHNHVRQILNERGANISPKKHRSLREAKASQKEKNRSKRRMWKRLSMQRTCLTTGALPISRELNTRSKSFWRRNTSMKGMWNTSITVAS